MSSTATSSTATTKEPTNILAKLKNCDQMKDSEISAVFDNYDSNADGKLDQKECALLLQHLLQLDMDSSKKALESVKSTTGSEDEASSLLNEAMGMFFDTQKQQSTLNYEVSLLIKGADTNKDLLLDKKEFLTAFRKHIATKLKEFENRVSRS
eukprot:TRINITY_DN9398_c0_g1_i1.p1 TRINITY_DN9398_c0_g1~~TRINITY_DN9398_c0_g1_i1.p1  ORF type:complete len:153 (-),score=58.48 TRINITY_DN9398_c0_g1_i1:64-522(-)